MTGAALFSFDATGSAGSDAQMRQGRHPAAMAEPVNATIRW